MSKPIEDYALIGNCESAALVARDGSIDWLAMPRFDSAAFFAALLGGPEHGHWTIAPSVQTSPARVSRRYRGDTLILETTFETPEGAVCLIDFMSRRDNACDLTRIVRGLRGRVALQTTLVVRFDYGCSVPWVCRQSNGQLHFTAGPDRLTLAASVAMRGEGLTTVGEFTLGEGEEACFSLAWSASYHAAPAALDAGAALAQTEDFWTTWAARLGAQDQVPEAVRRSLLTLKALAHWETGGIVAAATTSLPEKIGGTRNWDYRYCWLRDATLTLYALLGAGFVDEANAWRDWLVRAVGGSPADLQIMYGVAGERRLAEFTVAELPGYENSVPVRIGNAASTQVQLDVYGEVLDTLYVARRAGLVASQTGWAVECALIKHLEEIWQQPDDGIWEVRGGRQHFTHSKVMAWVAIDRALRSATEFKLEAPIKHWRALREAIHDDVCARGFDASQNSFVQAYGSPALDASLLLIPVVGFLPASDARVRGTVAAIEKRLLCKGLVLRYDSGEVKDGLPPGEGAFLACSFWLADNYILQGRIDEARALYENLLSCRNDVGLLAEEYDPVARRQLGNFPQAFSHLSLINTANSLKSTLGPAQQRAAGGHATDLNALTSNAKAQRKKTRQRKE